MEDSVKLAIVESLQKQCDKVNSYIKAMFFGIDEEDGDDATDGDAAAAPVVLVPWFEKPSPDKAIYMGCSMDPECRKQGKAHLTAFCVYCNERGHRKCMVEMEPSIVLRPEQKGKLSESLSLFQWCVRYATNTTAGLIAYMRGLPQCDCIKPEQEENDAASDSSILSSIVQSVAIKADGTSANKKRKRSTDEAEEEELPDGGKNNNKTDSE